MQGWFMCLESGLTPSKNSINVALKNSTDFTIRFPAEVKNDTTHESSSVP